MSSRYYRKTLLISGTLLLLLCLVATGIFINQLLARINQSLEDPWVATPLTILGRPPTITAGTALSWQELGAELSAGGLMRASFQQLKKPSQHEYLEWPHAICQMHLPPTVQLAPTARCLLAWLMPPPPSVAGILDREDSESIAPQPELTLLIWESGRIVEILSGEPLAPQSHGVRLPAPVIATVAAGKPITRMVVPLPDVPLACLQAVTAIEDERFLGHQGISLSGILRAAVFMGRKGGGSTITQQLVKNFFLTPERSLKRKLTELLMAVILELKLSKDEILERYLNVIYMGQAGTFQVMGFGAASWHYFGKNLSDASLAECALLASILNSPGRFNPFKYPEAAGARRARVLERMHELNMITASELDQALTAAMPAGPIRVTPVYEIAPYFLDAIIERLNQLKITDEVGMRILTGIDLNHQKLADQVTRDHLSALEQQLQAQQRKTQAAPLEALFVSVDLKTNLVTSLVGGRSFALSPYNRALKSHRQVGSLFKPLVYLTALEQVNELGEPYGPDTLIDDSPLRHEYEGQVWQPENYDRKFRGPIPLKVALAQSLNVPTAKLGLEVGLKNIIELSRRLGLTSPILEVPALTLGAFELYPWEVLSAYSVVARRGLKSDLDFIDSVETANGRVLWQRQSQMKTVVARDTAQQLVDILKLTPEIGTARALQKFLPETACEFSWRELAAKTGTTSDYRDAWFVAFSRDTLTLAWVGRDNNTSHGLTGASAALPIIGSWFSQSHCPN